MDDFKTISGAMYKQELQKILIKIILGHDKG
jgi:hypothetical protein